MDAAAMSALIYGETVPGKLVAAAEVSARRFIPNWGMFLVLDPAVVIAVIVFAPEVMVAPLTVML